MSATVIRGNGSGGSGIGVLNIANAAWASTVNATTEGTIDWFAYNGVITTPARNIAHATMHSKILGGGIVQSFDWVLNGTNTVFNQSFGQGVTTTLNDDTAAAALTVSTGGTGLNSVANSHFGFRLRAPALGTLRVLRIYTSQFSSVLTMTARLLDGSVDDVVSTYDGGAGTTALRCWTINYKAEDPCDLAVQCLLTTNYGGTPNIKFSCATLGVV